jgi:hypothetical protein
MLVWVPQIPDEADPGPATEEASLSLPTGGSLPRTWSRRVRALSSMEIFLPSVAYRANSEMLCSSLSCVSKVCTPLSPK